MGIFGSKFFLVRYRWQDARHSLTPIASVCIMLRCTEVESYSEQQSSIVSVDRWAPKSLRELYRSNPYGRGLALHFLEVQHI